MSMIRPFTPRTRTGERLKWELSDDDHAKISRGLGWEAIVTNLLDGKTYRVKGATCGLSRCNCDTLVVGEVTL